MVRVFPETSERHGAEGLDDHLSDIDTPRMEALRKTNNKALRTAADVHPRRTNSGTREGQSHGQEGQSPVNE